MASRYLKATGNYSAAATWSETDGGAAGASAPTSADDVFITANGNGLTLTLDTASAAKSVLCSGANTATLAETQTWTIGGNVTLLATMTIPNTITFTVTGTGAFAGSTLTTLGAINLNGTAHTVSGAFTCSILTRNGTAAKTDTVTFTSGTTVTCTTCAMIGNSAVNRLLVQSSILGTAATITATNWTGTLNADIMDITATNAVDFSAGGLNIVIGDCGGNTGITFTAAAAQTWDGATGNWSTAVRWTSRVPLPQDDVSAGGAGNTITVDMPRIGKSITFTGTPTVSLSNDISNYGSFLLVAGMTYTHNNNFVTARGRGSFTLTTAGKIFYSYEVYAYGGIITQQDNLTCSSSENMYLSAGTWDTGIFNIVGGYFTIRYAFPKILTGSGLITLNGTSATNKVSNSGSNTSITGTLTIVLTNSTANAQTFVGRGLTYNNLTIAGAGNYALTITGSNTFKVLKVDAFQSSKTIAFTDATTQTAFDLTRDRSNNRITLTGTSTAGWTIKSTNTRIIQVPYLSLFYSKAIPQNMFQLGTGSMNGVGNKGWLSFGSLFRLPIKKDFIISEHRS